MDPRKRQKKLERRRAKAKAEKKALATRDPRALTTRIERAASAPFLHCYTTNVLWDEGMSHVVVSRLLESGNVAFVVFLLDVYCLGVKDVTFDIVSRSRYERQVYGKLVREYDPVTLEPAAARKLIEGAVEFAREHGLPPHRDYPKAKRIFGNVDPNACGDEFVYGKDGKPFFIAGPHDGPSRCRQIIDTLTARCGAGGFHYLLAVPRSATQSLAGGNFPAEDDDDELD
jgi:hypothetical protein